MLNKKTEFQRSYPILKKKITKNILKDTLYLLICLMPFFILQFINLITTRNFGSVFWMGALIFLYLAVASCILVYQIAHFIFYFYDLTDTHVIISKGIFHRQEITIPFDRIQDVYIEQDVFDRLFGLYDVHVSTATPSSFNRAHIDGVSAQDAEKIRMLILEKVVHPL